jgi:sulfite reductase (ferredoxin)
LRDHELEELHTTQDQNLAIMHVAQEKLSTLRIGLAALGLREPVAGDNVVACPGASTCRLGITSSTIVAPKLSGGIHDLSIRVSGCQNGCAQPETGDIGIYGEGRRLHGRLVPHYQTYFGGSGMSGSGGNGTGGGKLGVKGPSVPAARVVAVVARVEQTFAASGESGFFDWAHKQEDDYFKHLLADIIEVKEHEVPEVMRDHGSSADFRVLNFGGGECAGASQVQIGANFFEAAHEREYRRALTFQRKYDEAAQCSLAILQLLGGGLVHLLDGRRQDDPAQLVARLAQHGLDEIGGEFTRLAGLLSGLPEASEENLAPLHRAVDEWTIKVARFCVAQDEQLDLNEALPQGVIA